MKALSEVKQKFAVSRATGDADFKGDGLRNYALYRDFGFATATEGMVHAHIIKLIPPCTDEVRTRHRHLLQMQMVYVLKGWMKIEHEGQGVMTMKAGDAWLMPPGIRHTVLDYSDDCQNLEITIPAKFDTVNADQ
jgi:mannose-6-phosphate isomerase-like protein (cupin superfamily)